MIFLRQDTGIYIKANSPAKLTPQRSVNVMVRLNVGPRFISLLTPLVTLRKPLRSTFVGIESTVLSIVAAAMAYFIGIGGTPSVNRLILRTRRNAKPKGFTGILQTVHARKRLRIKINVPRPDFTGILQTVHARIRPRMKINAPTGILLWASVELVPLQACAPAQETGGIFPRPDVTGASGSLAIFAVAAIHLLTIVMEVSTDTILTVVFVLAVIHAAGRLS
jgi:hypothetical protein